MWTSTKNMNTRKISTYSYSRFFFSLLILSDLFFSQLWRLRVTQNALQLSFFFLFLISTTVFIRTFKSFWSKFRQSFLCTCITKIRKPSLYTLANYCAYILKFPMCEHGMPCAVEINSNGGSKRGDMWSTPSTTTSISPLPQYP